MRPFVRQMLETGNGKNVLDMLDHMRVTKNYQGEPHLSDAEYNDLCLLVHSYNARLTDTSPMWSLPNQQLVRSHGVAKQQRRDTETLEQAMKKAEEKMSSVWDAKTSK